MMIKLISCALLFLSGFVFGQHGKIDQTLAEDAVRAAYKQGRYSVVLEIVE